MPTINPNEVQWDPIDPAAVQWDDAKPQPKAPAMGRGEKIMRGMVDPIEGAAQMLVRALPDGAVRAGNRLNNWLADAGVPLARLEGPDEQNLSSLVTGQKASAAAPLDRLVKQREADYQGRRAASGESGIDGYRLLGNVVSPANLSIARLMPAAATLPGRMGVGALGGAASAAMQPVLNTDDFAAEKLKQMATGTVAGGLTPAVVAGLGRAISPAASTNPAVQTLRAEGVRPTIGQTMGGVTNKLEEKAMSLPLVGDAIAAARRRAAGDLNAAVANRALEPIGQRLPAGLQGREAVAHVQQTLSDAYENLLPRMTVRADQAFRQDVGQLRQMVNTGAMDPRAVQLFNRVLQNDVLGKFRGRQALTGQTLKDIEGDLGAQISRMQQSTDADQRLVADALREVQGSLRGLAARNNPQFADELQRINAGWANFKRLERAAGYVGADDGMFSAANLQSAVKALDRSKDKGRFSRGESLMQDLSDSAKTVLGPKVPDSGTAGRLMWPATAGAAFMDPMLTGSAIGGGSLMYSPWGQSLLRGLLATRPQAAQPVAGLLNQASPMLAPAGGLLALEAMNQ